VENIVLVDFDILDLDVENIVLDGENIVLVDYGVIVEMVLDGEIDIDFDILVDLLVEEIEIDFDILDLGVENIVLVDFDILVDLLVVEIDIDFDLLVGVILENDHYLIGPEGNCYLFLAELEKKCLLLVEMVLEFE